MAPSRRLQRHIQNEQGDAGCHDEAADARNQVRPVPAEPGFIDIDPARHPHQSGQMHDQEGQVEADEDQPEGEGTDGPRGHPPGHLRIPVITRGEKGKEEAAKQHIMQVGYHEMGVVDLPVERYQRQHNTRQPAHHEYDEETEEIEHRQIVARSPAIQGRNPGEELHGGGHGHQHARDREEGLGQMRNTDREHVVDPQSEADEARGDDARHDPGIADQRGVRRKRVSASRPRPPRAGK